MWLMDLLKRPPAAPARFLDGRVGYALGDVHGRADLLLRMFDEMEAQAEADTRPHGPPILVFLGDYVDRGPRSDVVLDMILSGRPHGFERRFLKGNHEASMLAFIDQPLANRAWVLHGGMETLVAYGVRPPSPLEADDQAWIDAAALLKERLPPLHLAFLSGLERYAVLGEYAFVHAGIRPGRPIEVQSDDDLLWIRKPFLASRQRHALRIVHGHTPSDQPYADYRRIGVDTGAYASGRLSAVRLEGDEVRFLTVSERDLPAHPLF